MISKEETLQGINKKLTGKSSILAQGKSCVLPTNPLFTPEIDYIAMYPSDR